MQRTLKRELKELEIVKREAIEVSRSISLWEKFSFLVGASSGGRVGRGMVGQPIISILIRLVLVRLGSECSSGGVLFSQGELASVFPHFNGPPGSDQEVRWLKTCGI